MVQAAREEWKVRAWRGPTMSLVEDLFKTVLCYSSLQASMANVESESDPSLRHQQALFLQHLKANLEDQVGDSGDN